MINRSKKYRRLFRVQGLRFLIDDIWMGFYKELSALTTFNNDHYTSYLPEAVIEECLANGLELYGNRKKFEEFKAKFSEFKQGVLTLCEKITTEDDISKQELAKAFQLFSEFFKYYSKTEFFYTDRVALQDNTFLHKEIGEIKFSGREVLNRIFFGKDSYLNFILTRLSAKFNHGIEEMRQYSVQEILNLFERKKVSSQVIAERNTAFIIVGDGSSIDIHSGENAKQAIVTFQEREELALPEIKGTIANAGKAVGKVKLIISGYDNYDELNKEISRMNKGEVLVSETTSPELIVACHKAAAIVSNQGGLLSHAAIISRELGIPCIVGTEIATKVLKDGDLVEVDAEKGVVRKIDVL